MPHPVRALRDRVNPSTSLFPLETPDPQATTTTTRIHSGASLPATSPAVHELTPSPTTIAGTIIFKYTLGYTIVPLLQTFRQFPVAGKM